MCDDDDVNELLLPLFTTLNKKRSGVFNWKCSEAMAWRAVDNKGVHDFIMFASSATTKKREFHSSRTTARKNLVYSNFPLSIIQKPHRHLSPKKREFGAHEHEADENLRLSVLACPLPLRPPVGFQKSFSDEEAEWREKIRNCMWFVIKSVFC